MENKRPKVSVIIPNYNYAKYIKMAVQSVQRQTLKDIEIIIVDDCSSDDSLAIVSELQKQDPRIKIIQNKNNSGAGISRNNGIAEAKGEYIKFLDSDDTMEPGVLEKMYNAAMENDVNIVCGNMMNANANGVPNSQSPYYKYLCSQLNGRILTPEEAEKYDATFIFDMIGIGDCLYKRELFDDVKFPDLKWEDFATIPILKYREGKILYINITVYNYRQYGQNTTGRDCTHKTNRIMDIVYGAQILRKNMPEQYQAKVDYLEFIHTIIRISDIMKWNDCAVMHKSVLISALFGCLNADVNNIYENPYMEQRFPALKLINDAKKRLEGFVDGEMEAHDEGDVQNSRSLSRNISDVIAELKGYQNTPPTVLSRFVSGNYNKFMNKYNLFVLRIEKLKTDKVEFVMGKDMISRAAMEYQTLMDFNDFCDEAVTTSLLSDKQKKDMINLMAEAMYLSIPKIRNLIVYGRYNDAIRYLDQEFLNMSREECLKRAEAVTTSESFKRRTFSSILPGSVDHVPKDIAKEIIWAEKMRR